MKKIFLCFKLYNMFSFELYTKPIRGLFRKLDYKQDLNKDVTHIIKLLHHLIKKIKIKKIKKILHH